MRKPRLIRWNNVESNLNLLLIAQRIEESLFDYTFESYKTPTFNTHTRCNELINCIRDVEQGKLYSKSLGSIISELVWSIKLDLAAQTLIGPLMSSYAKESWWDISNIKKIKIQALSLKDIFKDRKYEKCTVKLIRGLLDNSTEKSNLINLSMNLVVEWLNRGHSKGYIFASTRATFFSPSSKKIDEKYEVFDSYINRFEVEKSNYSVLFRLEGTREKLYEFLKNINLKVYNSAPHPRTSNRKESAFLKDNHNGIFVEIENIDALDARRACDDAILRLDILTSIMAFYMHRNRIEVVGGAIAYCGDKSVVLKEMQSPLMKENECEIEQLPEFIQKTFRSFDSYKSDGSLYRFLSALGLHYSSLSLKDTSVQLTSLWSSLESIMPVEADKLNISVVIESMLPILCKNYPLTLINELESDLKRCCPSAYDEARSQLPDVIPAQYHCAAIIAIDANEPLRDIIYQSLDTNPLLRYRLYKTKKCTDSAASILKLINGHRRKIDWQIRRIYRSRNLVAHSGAKPLYLSSLVENLHTYFHKVIDAVDECASAPHFSTSIDSALLACRLEDQKYCEYLNDNKTLRTDNEHLVELISGPIRARTVW
jgi:hypothetical protein